MTPLVEMHDIHKAFGAVKALDGVDLIINRAEIVGLVGDNAAGKSTLMKVLSGAYEADEGTVETNGKVEMVYQDLALADNLDVTANIYMGREKVAGLFLDNGGMEAEVRKLIDRLKIDIADIRQLVATLSGGQRQAVAVGRAMAFEAELVILDEPTASLSPEAAEHVLDLIRTLKEHGIAVILINHRTDEVKRVADRMLTMRHGKIVSDAPVGAPSCEELSH